MPAITRNGRQVEAKMSDGPDLVKPKGPFPLWLADFERDTMQFTSEQRYLYLKVLVSIWEAGGYILASRDTLHDIWGGPRRGKQFAVNCELTESYLQLIPHPVVNNSHLWTQKRVLEELENLAEFRQKRQDAGRLGGLKSQSNARNRIQAPLDPPTPTLTESTITNTEDTNDPPEPSRYAYDGEVVKLNHDDFDKWEDLFPSLNLRRELAGLDLWWQTKSPAERKKWFVPTFNMLRRKQEGTESAKPADKPDSFREVTVGGETRYIDGNGQQFIKGPGGIMVPVSGGSV